MRARNAFMRASAIAFLLCSAALIRPGMAGGAPSNDAAHKRSLSSRYGATGGVVDALRTRSGQIPLLWGLSSVVLSRQCRARRPGRITASVPLR